MLLHNLDEIDERDLSEAPRLAKEKQPVSVMIGLGLGAALFLGLLVYGSLPELSPEEIVSMDGYEGEQPTRHIFNIQSLEETAKKTSAETPSVAVVEQGSSTEAASPENVDNLPPIVKTEPIPESETVESITEQSTVVGVIETPVVEVEAPVELVEETELPIATTEPVSTPVETSTAADTSIRTITSSTAAEDKVIAATATTPTIEETVDTVVIASVVAPEPMPVPVRSTTTLADSSQFDVDANGRLLPLRLVLGDATEVKATPSAQSRTVLSLDSGVIVTAFERLGEWIHVGTNDGSSITGYVQESSLKRLDNNP